MSAHWRIFVRDERGFVITAELVLISTLLVAGLTVGLSAIRTALTSELTDIADSIGSLNQSYYFFGKKGCQTEDCQPRSRTYGSAFLDRNDTTKEEQDAFEAALEAACPTKPVCTTRCNHPADQPCHAGCQHTDCKQPGCHKPCGTPCGQPCQHVNQDHAPCGPAPCGKVPCSQAPCNKPVVITNSNGSIPVVPEGAVEAPRDNCGNEPTPAEVIVPTDVDVVIDSHIETDVLDDRHLAGLTVGSGWSNSWGASDWSRQFYGVGYGSGGCQSGGGAVVTSFRGLPPAVPKVECPPGPAPYRGTDPFSPGVVSPRNMLNSGFSWNGQCATGPIRDLGTLGAPYSQVLAPVIVPTRALTTGSLPSTACCGGSFETRQVTPDHELVTPSLAAPTPAQPEAVPPEPPLEPATN